MSTNQALREALEYLVKELNAYAAKNGLGPARLMHALTKAEAALADSEPAQEDGRECQICGTPLPKASSFSVHGGKCMETANELNRLRAALAAPRQEGPFDGEAWPGIQCLKFASPEDAKLAEKLFNDMTDEIQNLRAGQAATPAQLADIQHSNTSVTEPEVPKAIMQAAPAAAQLQLGEVRKQALLEAARAICVRCDEGLSVEFYGTSATPSHVVGGERAHCYAWAIHTLLRSQPAGTKKLLCGCEANNMSRCPVHDAP